jgi:hypothetical protein
MTLSGLLRRTAERYEQARQIVAAEHPNISKGDFEKLVAEKVQLLASQNLHLSGNEEGNGKPRGAGIGQPVSSC